MSECTEKLKINPALRLLVLPLSTAGILYKSSRYY